MLERAAGILSPDEFAYAKGLAAAFLDEEKVADLASFPRWTALKPLTTRNPPNAKPRIRKAKSKAGGVK